MRYLHSTLLTLVMLSSVPLWTEAGIAMPDTLSYPTETSEVEIEQTEIYSLEEAIAVVSLQRAVSNLEM